MKFTKVLIIFIIVQYCRYELPAPLHNLLRVCTAVIYG